MQQKILKIALPLFLIVNMHQAKDFNLSDYSDTQPTIEQSYEQLKFLFNEKQRAYIDKQFKKLEESKKKSITFFYLTSSNMGKSGIINFNNAIKKLQKKYYIEGMVVLRGFDKKKDFTDFVYSAYKKDTPFRLKIHPKIFREFKVDRVPAYAVSICNIGNHFSFRECKNLYFAKGNGKLEDFIEKVAKKNSLFEKLYLELIKPDE